MLERRVLLTTDVFDWVAGNGAFNDANNWIDTNTGKPALPTATAQVSIPQGVIVTVSQSLTVDSIYSLGVIELTGGTLTVNNQFDRSNIDTLDISSGATFHAAGGLTILTGNSNYKGTFNVDSGATLDFFGNSQQINTGATFAGTGLYDFDGANVFINGNFTAPTNFELDAGNIMGSGTWTIAKNFTWTGGNLDSTGTLVVPAGTTLAIGGANLKSVVDGYTLNLNGTTTFSNSAGSFVVATNGIVNNAGTFTVHGNTPLAPYLGGGASGNGTFNNSGTLNIDGNTSGSVLITDGLALHNSGTVNVLNGIFQVNAGGVDTGTFNAAANSTVSFTGGTETIASTAPAAALSGAGTYKVDVNGTLTVLPSISLANLAVANGVLTNPGTLTVTGSFAWTGGDLDGSGTTTIAAGSTTTFSSANSKSLSNGHVLNVAGTTTFSGSGPLLLYTDGVLNNTGAFTMQGGETVTSGSSNGGVFNNSGTLNVAAGIAQTASFAGDVFNNSGTTNVQSGTLAIGSGGVDTGAFNVSAGATLDITGGTETIANSAPSGALAGQGVYQVDVNGALKIGPSLSVVNLLLSGGTLSGAGTLTVTGSFNWTGGGLDGAGTTVVPTGVTLAISGPNDKSLTNNHVLNNAGTITWSGSGALSLAGDATINNTSTFTVQGGELIVGNGKGIINNSGTLNVAAGTAQTAEFNAIVNNTSAINVQSGTLALDAGGTQSGTFTAAANAALNFNGGTNAIIGNGVTLSGAGSVGLMAGAMSTGNNGAKLTVSPTTTFVWSGQFKVPVGATLDFNGTLNLIGASNEVISGGGTFKLDGTLTQQGAGNLEIDGASTVTTLLIPSGSIYNIQADSGAVGSNAMIVNQGLIEKTGGIGTSTIQTGLNSTAAITVNSGTLALAPSSSAINGGTFTVAAGAVLDLTGGASVNYGGTITGTGAGQIQLNGGVLKVGNATSGATFNFPNGLFAWNGGTINTNLSKLNIPAGGAVQVGGTNGQTLMGGGSLNVAGTVTDSGAGALTLQGNTTLAIASGGTWDFQSNAGIKPGTLLNGSGLVAVNKGGTLSKSAGTSSSTISTPISNLGTVQVTEGTLNLSSTVDQVSGTTLTGGTWNSVADAGFEAALSFNGQTNLNTVGVAANVTINGVNSSFPALSALSAIKGSYSLLGGKSFNSVGAVTDSGKLTLGAGSTLAVKGAFTETAIGQIATQIGGTNAAPTIGAISATGPISLAGSLAVTSPTNVAPAVGKSLIVVNNLGKTAITGTFAGLPNGKVISVGKMSFTIFYKKGTNGLSLALNRTA
jgi:hypothetical protein